MSISLTVYDIFADLIPGIFYLYIFNQAFAAYKLPNIDITQLDKFYNLLLVAIIAYVLGHAIHPPVSFLYRRIMGDRAKTQVLQRLKRQHPELQIQFNLPDSGILYSVIEYQQLTVAQTIDIFRASLVMMRNISAALFLYSLLQMVMIIQTRTLSFYPLMALASILLTIFTLIRAFRFETMFYQAVYRSALNYGTRLEDVLNLSRKITAGEANGTNKAKKTKNAKEVEFE